MKDGSASMDFDLKTASVLVGLAAVPIATALLVPRPHWMPWALFTLILASLIGGDRIFFSVDELSPLSPHFGYRGYDRGLQVTVADLVLLAMAGALLLQRFQGLRFRDAQLTAFLAYAGVTILSLSMAAEPHFTAWEIVRTLKWVLLFWVVLNTIRDERSLRFALAGVVAFLVVQMLAVLWQRYGLGVHRTRGTLAHPNSLGMTVNLFFPLVLVAWIRVRGSLLPLVALVALGTIGIEICTLSRGGLCAMLLSALAVFVIELTRWDRRLLVRRGALLGALLLPVLAISLDSITHRFGEMGFAPGLTRRLQNELAVDIIKHNPLGVGANNFPLAASASVGIRTQDPGTLNDDPGLVHNAFLLETAETGWIGLAVLLWLGLLPVARGWRLLRRGRGLGWMGSAIVAGTCTFWSQAQLEWVYKQTEVFAAFVVLCGIAAGALWVDRLDEHPPELPRAS